MFDVLIKLCKNNHRNCTNCVYLFYHALWDAWDATPELGCACLESGTRPNVLLLNIQRQRKCVLSITKQCAFKYGSSHLLSILNRNGISGLIELTQCTCDEITNTRTTFRHVWIVSKQCIQLISCHQ